MLQTRPVRTVCVACTQSAAARTTRWQFRNLVFSGKRCDQQQLHRSQAALTASSMVALHKLDAVPQGLKTPPEPAIAMRSSDGRGRRGV